MKDSPKKPRVQDERTPDEINALVKAEGEKSRKQQQARFKREVAKRNQPSRTPDEMTVDIIDGITTFCQLLKGRDLTSPAVLDALEDLNDNGDLFQLTRPLIVNGGRRSIKL
ncbi:MAG: hypothetical protein ACRYFX_19055 [Janthinobacterium lividum]